MRFRLSIKVRNNINLTKLLQIMKTYISLEYSYSFIIFFLFKLVNNLTNAEILHRLFSSIFCFLVFTLLNNQRKKFLEMYYLFISLL